MSLRPKLRFLLYLLLIYYIPIGTYTCLSNVLIYISRIWCISYLLLCRTYYVEFIIKELSSSGFLCFHFVEYPIDQIILLNTQWIKSFCWIPNESNHFVEYPMNQIILLNTQWIKSFCMYNQQIISYHLFYIILMNDFFGCCVSTEIVGIPDFLEAKRK